MEDAADGQAEELVDGAHPFAVARSQVIVHRHHVHAAAAQGVEIDRQRRHQRLAFAGRHFRDLARVQRVAADELHVERHHFPLQRMLANGDLRPAQAPAGGLYHGESLGQDLVQPPGERLLVLDLGQLLFPGGRLLAQNVVGDASAVQPRAR